MLDDAGKMKGSALVLDMPENKKPPAMRVVFYCFQEGWDAPGRFALSKKSFACFSEEKQGVFFSLYTRILAAGRLPYSER